MKHLGDHSAGIEKAVRCMSLEFRSEVWARVGSHWHKDGIWKGECVPLGGACRLIRRLGIFEWLGEWGWSVVKGPESGERTQSPLSPRE